MKNATIITATLATLLMTSMMSGTAAAASCKSITIYASGESAGAVARFRKRRAERRAENAWENYVANHYGKKFADVDDAKGYKVTFSLNAKGNTVATIKGKPCS